MRSPLSRPKRDQAESDAIDLIGELCVGEPQPLEWDDQRFVIGVGSDGAIESRPDRVFQQRRIGSADRVRGAGHVGPSPSRLLGLYLSPGRAEIGVAADRYARAGGTEMQKHDEAVSTLAAELDRVEQFVRGMSPDDWNRPTLLEPFDVGAPPWTIKELVAHIDISIGLTLGFLDSIQDGQPGRDRVSFFIADRSQVAPVVYDYAKGLAGQHTPESLADKLGATFQASVDGARSQPADTIGSGYFALMRLDEWIPSRTVEAVVHGLDLTDALGASPIASADGVTTTKSILDDLLTRRTVPGRPSDLGDDLAFIRAAPAAPSTPIRGSHCSSDRGTPESRTTWQTRGLVEASSLLRIDGLTKRYPGVTALDDLTMDASTRARRPRRRERRRQDDDVPAPAGHLQTDRGKHRGLWHRRRR